MLSLAIGLVLTLAIGYILSGSLQLSRTQGESARIQETSRFILDLLGRQITQAGYTAISPNYTDTKMDFTGTPISGEHGITAIRAGERKADSDYLAISLDAATDCLGNATATGTAQNEFYLDKQDQLVCASGGGAPEVLADGVESFRVSYGIDSDGDYSVDRYLSQPADWSQVRTVRICLIKHALSNGTSPTAQRYQDCDGVTRTAPDTRLRRVLSATFQLRNRGL
jgi:type IV pilus assembly protein PilW